MQIAPGVPIPSTHEATPQVVDGPTRLVHAVALVPSQTFDVQTLFGSDCAQAARVPTGGPLMVTHVPTLPAVLHA
jgi:hypothetical protein